MEHVLQHEKQSPARGPHHADAAHEVAGAQHLGAQLQQQAGNQAMQQLLRGGVIRAKLAVSPPDDADEQEAEETSGRIMRSHAGAGAAATSCSCGDDEENMCDECRQKHAAIARKASEPGRVSSPSHAVVSQMMRSPGHPLDHGTRAFFEPRFGRDVSHVRVHADSNAAESAGALRAHAYALGNDIWFGAGKYSPATNDGRHLLAHEIAHTFQQQSSPGASNALRRNAVTIGRVDDPLEAEADHVANSVMHSPGPQAAVSADRTPAVRGAWYDPAVAAGEWLGGKAVDAGSATVDAGKWLGNKAVAGAEWAGGKALEQAEQITECVKSLGKGAMNLATGNVSSLADVLGVEAPTEEGPAMLDTLTTVLKHPCLQMIPGYGMVSGAVGILDSVGKFLTGAWKLIQNPQPIIDGLQNSIGKMIAGIPGYVSGLVQKALSKLGSKLKEHGEGVWRHLEPKLQYLAKNWWQVIKDTGWQLLWPWPSVAKDLTEVWHHLKAAGDHLWNLRFSKALDELLAVSRGVNSAVGSLYGWFFIASVLVGTIIGAFFGGAGAIPGAAAGAAFAGEVGEGLLMATVGIETASIVKAVYNLLAQKETKEEKEQDYEQIASSSLTLAITGVMVLLSEIAVKFAQGILEKAAGLLKKVGATEVDDAAAAAARNAKGEAPKVETPKVEGGEGKAPDVKDPETKVPDVKDPDAKVPDTKGGEPPEGKRVKGEEPTEGVDPATGEPVEKLPDGEAKVTEDGRCEICHSPCQFTKDMLKKVSDHMQSVRNAMADTPAGRQLAQLENTLRRLQLLEDAMSESAARGKLKAEFNSKFRESFRRLSGEADALYNDLFDPQELSSDAAREMKTWKPDEPGSVMDDPNAKYDPERALEGTAYHDVIEAAVVQDLPAGSALTENTIQDFFKKLGIKGKGIPKRSSGIDLYILDRASGTVTPVDITNVAGSTSHVGKLVRNFESLAEPFEKAGFKMKDPIEIEYVGQNFDEAARNIANELKALAR